MPEQTPLQAALIEACEFARAHGLEGITVDDFAIQRSPAGTTHATHIGEHHAVTVTIGPAGHATYAVAELDWIHNTADPDRMNCVVCEPCAVCEPLPCECEQRVVDVYLPGDEPAQEVSR